MMTGYSDLELVKNAINKARVHNYMEKPLDNKELINTVLYLFRDHQEETHEQDISFHDGNSYLILEPDIDFSLKTCLKRMEKKEEGMIITRKPINKLQRNHQIDLEYIQYHWLTKVIGPGNLNPVNLEFIADIIIRYYEEGGDTVLLGGIDTLLRENSSNRFHGFLENLTDVVSLTNGVLVIGINPKLIPDNELDFISQKMHTYEV